MQDSNLRHAHRMSTVFKTARIAANSILQIVPVFRHCNNGITRRFAKAAKNLYHHQDATLGYYLGFSLYGRTRTYEALFPKQVD